MNPTKNKQQNPYLRSASNLAAVTGHPILSEGIDLAGGFLSKLFGGKKKAQAPQGPAPAAPTQPTAPAAPAAGQNNAPAAPQGNQGGGPVNPPSLPTPGQGGQLSQLFNQGKAATFNDLDTVDNANNNYAKTYAAFQDALRNNLSNRTQTTTNDTNTTGQINTLGNLAVSSASAGVNAAAANRESRVNALSSLFNMAAPKTLSPTDYAYSPIDDINSINEGNQSSTYGRTFNAGQAAGTQALGTQSVNNDVKIGTINNTQSVLNGLFSGYTDFGLVPLTEWKNKIAALTSSGQIASLQTLLNSVASQVEDGSIKQQLQSVSGNLANSSPSTIQAALNAAKAYITAQQGAIRTTAQNRNLSSAVPTNPTNLQVYTTPSGQRYIYHDGSDGQGAGWESFSSVGGDTNQAINIPKASHLAYVNNNPGNLKFVGQPGAVMGANGFAKFATPQEGFNALIRQIGINQKQNKTLAAFAYDYAPPTENDTGTYIRNLITLTGSKWNTPISQIDPTTLAKAVAMLESSTKIA